MTEKERGIIIQKAYQIAMSRGYKPPETLKKVFAKTKIAEHESLEIYKALFFSDQFCMKFWGISSAAPNPRENPLDFYKEVKISARDISLTKYDLPNWKYHQLQMVLADDPTDHLKQFIL